MTILILCLFIPVISLIFDFKVAPEDIPVVSGTLVAIAAAIFTIMSIWVAFLYPNILRTLKGENLVNVDFSSDGEETSRLKEIISVIVQSASTMIAIILVLLLSSFLANLSLTSGEIARQLIQFVLLYFCGIQISALVSTISINMSFIDALERQRKKRAKDWDI